jgi:hypothetical protein
MHRHITFTISAVAALALPMTALAHPGGGPDGAKQHGKPADPGAQGRAHRCAKTHTVGFQLHGLFGSFDGTTLTLSSAKGNKHAQPAITNGTATVVVGSAQVNFGELTDANADGTVGWDDVTALDRVIVHGRAPHAKHGCPAADQPAPTIQRIRVVAPDPADSADATDSTDATDDSTDAADTTQTAGTR